MTPDDVFVGSPPLAFTFGLGGIAVFPLRFGATATLLESAPPPNMIDIPALRSATASSPADTTFDSIRYSLSRETLRSLVRFAVQPRLRPRNHM